MEGKEEHREEQVEVERGEATQGGALMDDHGDGCDNTQDLSQ